MENYFKVKSTLFNLLKKKNGKAVINYDDDYGKKLAPKLNCDVSLFSKTNLTKSFFSQINDYKNKIDGIIKSNTGSYTIESNLFGSYNLENILAAVTTLDSLKISENDCRCCRYCQLPRLRICRYCRDCRDADIADIALSLIHI